MKKMFSYKLLKRSIGFISAFLLYPLLILQLIQLSFIQTKITQFVSVYLSDMLHTKISVDKVYIQFFDNLMLENFYVEDEKNDTLLYVHKLKININELKFNENYLDFTKIHLNNPVINLKTDSFGVFNFQFIIDQFSSDSLSVDTSSSEIKIKCSNFILSNAKLLYKTWESDFKKGKLNYDFLKLSEFNLFITDFETIKDTFLLNIDSLSVKDHGGYAIKNIVSDIRLSPIGIMLRDFSYKAQNTDLLLDKMDFTFNSWESFSDFIHQVSMNISFNYQSKLFLHDLSYFIPELTNMNQLLKLRGNIKGRVDQLKLRDFYINYGMDTELQTNIDVIGLPNINETYFDIKINNFYTTRDDLSTLKSPQDTTKKLVSLPTFLQSLGVLDYRGRITGLSKNFVAIGVLSSNLGIIKTDVKITEDTTYKKLNIFGTIDAKRLDVGKIAGDTENFGRVSSSDTIDIDIYSDNTIKGKINGIIDSAFIYGYNYKNILLNGDLSKNTFRGDIIIDDKNLNTSFLGYINFEDKIPVFDFFLDLKYANLSKLKLTNDTVSSISFALNANFKGTKLDDINGGLFLTRPFVYTKTGNNLKINNFSISSLIKSYVAARELKEIKINSDYIDASIVGIFEFASLANSFKNFIANYLPSTKTENYTNLNNELFDKRDGFITDLGNNFEFEINLKNTQNITEMFMPELLFDDSTKITGEYNSIDNYIELTANSNEIIFDDIKLQNFVFNSNTRNQSLNFNFSSSKFNITDDICIYNFKINSETQNDTCFTEIKWDNKKDSASYRGNFAFNTFFKKHIDKDKFPYIEIIADKDSAYFNNRKWHIQKLRLQIDSSAIAVNNLFFHSREQMISANGKISANPDDELNIRIQSFDLNNLAPLLDNISIEGILSGDTKLMRLYDKPVFSTYDIIKDLEINEVPLGNLIAESRWIPDTSKLKLNIYTQRPINNDELAEKDTLKLLHLYGDYFPETDDMNFNFIVNWLKLNAFKPYFEEYISTSRFTFLSGNAKISGKTKNPQIKSEFNLKGGFFKINYLGTQYDINDTLGFYIDNNVIRVHKTQLFSDKATGYAYVNGEIAHRDFKDMKLNILLNTKNFQFLNKAASDSADFYGKAYATGTIKLSGSPELMVVDVQAKTEKNTVFYLPLTTSSEISAENNFVNFISNDTTEVEKDEDYEVDLSGVQMNFNLDITPEAEIQLIMDETVGDIIKARGTGTIKMVISPSGDFNMYGNLAMEKGEYLFTLQNILSKKFIIKKGGTIKWNGDPENAFIDLSAVYKLKKVNLYDLMLSDEYRDEKIPVNCNLIMRNSLMNPDITFALDMENANERVLGQINNLEQENINKQVLSLLVLNKFQPLPGLKPDPNAATSDARINTGELISNQLNHWLSDISNQFDVGVNYQTGDEITTDELELALSTQLWDDRITINGNVGVGGEDKVQTATNNTNNVVGEVDIEVKLNKKGNLKLKAYNKANEELEYGNAPYTQGVGIFFRKDFNKFRLFSIFKKNKNNNKHEKSKK